MRAQRDWLKTQKRVLNSKQGICAIKKQHDSKTDCKVVSILFRFFYISFSWWYNSLIRSVQAEHPV